MNVLILGARGMLGRDLVAMAPQRVRVTALDLPEVDVTVTASVEEAFEQSHPDIVINCAAYTAVDKAESEAEQAHVVNAVAPGIIGSVSNRWRAAVLHYSTDYVFDGSETRPYRPNDPTGPLSVYGRTKLAGERALVSSGAVHLIVRTAWLYGACGKSFPRTMWERARAGQPTRVVTDQIGRPTWTRDLATATWRWAAQLVRQEGRTPSLVHATNAGDPISWFGVAERVFQRAERADLLSQCTTSDYPTPAHRPAWSVHDTTASDDVVGQLPDWSTSLDRFLDELEREP